jgi:hypothetical protein
MGRSADVARPAPADARPSGSTPLRARLPGFAYWARWPVIGLLVLAVKAVFGSVGPADWIAVALLASTVWLRTRIGALTLRVFVLLVVVGWVLVTGFGVHWAWLAALGTVVVVVGVYRQVGSLRPRLIGVPRPESVLEDVSPVSRTDDDAVQLVDALDELWGSTRPGGPREGSRAVHSHGSGACGTLTSSLPDGVAVDVFGRRDERGQPIPIDAIVRFSNTSGALHRDDSLRTPRGMAVRLMPVAAGDTGMDLILADGRRFPVNTVDDFYGFLRRFGRLLRYVPFALLGRTRVLALLDFVPILRPTSFVNRRFHGVNTFSWCGEPVRYLAVPTRSVRARVRSGDRRWRLDRDLRDRLAQGPVEFELRLVRGRGLPRDLQLDARRAWPRWMPTWSLGTLRLTNYVEPAEVDALGFDPFRLPVGVEPSADEILLARRAAYPESRLRRCPMERSGGQRPPSSCAM